jgi:hypothetical protein
MGKVRSPIDSECYTQSSETFRFNQIQIPFGLATIKEISCLQASNSFRHLSKCISRSLHCYRYAACRVYQRGPFVYCDNTLGLQYLFDLTI